MSGRRGDRKAVVLVEVAGTGVASTEALVETTRGVLGDVLGEPARRRARGEDAGDGLLLEGTEGVGMAERAVEVGGGEALAQEQDLARVVARLPRRMGPEQTGEKGRGHRAHLLESDAQLVEVDDSAAPRLVRARRRHVRAGAARRELVARDAAQVGGVDEELVLRDADGQEVGHVLVRHRVAVAVPRDEAVDAAHAVDDPRGVVGVHGQRHERELLVGKQLERAALELLVLAHVTDRVLPMGELSAEVVDVAETAPVEKTALEFPEAALDVRLVIGMRRTARLGPKGVVRRKRQKARIVDGLAAFPAEHDGLLTIVLAHARGAAEAREGGEVSVHQRVQVAAREDAEALAVAVDEHVREDLHRLPAGGGEVDRVRRPVALGHFARAVVGRRQARRGRGPRPRGAHVQLDRRVAAVEAGRAQLLEDPLRGDLRVAREQVGDPGAMVVDLAQSRRTRGRHRQRRVRLLAGALMPGEQLTDRVAADRQRPRDRAAREALLAERDRLVRQLLASGPRRHEDPFR